MKTIVLIISGSIYFGFLIYSIYWISQTNTLIKKQKKINIIISFICPFWIILVKSVLTPLSKRKGIYDQGWSNQYSEGSVRGSHWAGGSFGNF